MTKDDKKPGKLPEIGRISTRSQKKQKTSRTPSETNAEKPKKKTFKSKEEKLKKKVINKTLGKIGGSPGQVVIGGYS